MLSKKSIELLRDMIENRLSEESAYEDNDLNTLQMCRQELIELEATQQSRGLLVLLRLAQKITQRRLKKRPLKDDFSPKKRDKVA